MEINSIVISVEEYTRLKSISENYQKLNEEFDKRVEVRSSELLQEFANTENYQRTADKLRIYNLKLEVESLKTWAGFLKYKIS